MRAKGAVRRQLCLSVPDMRCEHGLHCRAQAWASETPLPFLQGHQDTKRLHVCRRAAEAWGLWGEAGLTCTLASMLQ